MPRARPACGRCSRPGSRRAAAARHAAAIRPTGTLTRNTARQLVNSTSTPPSTCPATNPIDAVAPYRPSALVRCWPSAKLVVISDSAAGATSAAPAPWSTPGGDQQGRVAGQAAGQRGGREREQAGHEHGPPAEQVGGPAAEDEQAAEGDGVAGDHPLHGGGRRVQLPADGRQRDVDDAEVQHDHERGHQNERET